MADFRLCSVPGCGKSYLAKGYCNMHYQRVRSHGDFTVVKKGGTRNQPGRHATRFFNEVVVNYMGDECLTWPFARSSTGYANIGIRGRTRGVHRLACKARNGPPPSPDHYATHVCGQGHNGCVNPKHMVWATPAENASDKIEHGTHNRGERHISAKLSEDDVKSIRASQGDESSYSLSGKYGVSHQLIRAIWRRTAWTWLD